MEKNNKPLFSMRKADEETSLERAAFLINARAGRSTHKFTYENALKVIECLEKGMTNREIEKVVELSAPLVSEFLREFKLAYQAGYSLEKYFAEGRPFKRKPKTLYNPNDANSK